MSAFRFPTIRQVLPVSFTGHWEFQTLLALLLTNIITLLMVIVMQVKNKSLQCVEQDIGMESIGSGKTFWGDFTIS